MPRKKTEEQVGEVAADKNSADSTICAHCGKPASIMSPQGRFYCSLACQTNHGD